MKDKTFTLKAPDDHEIFVRYWKPSSKVKTKGVVHISHGMAEHSGRYDATARFLNKKGYHVYSHDHRGHGNSAKGLYGHYADENGWEKVVSDFALVQDAIANEFPQQPKFVLAHSMGSFIAMSYLRRPQTHLDGIVISGSNYDSPAKYHALRPVIQAEKLRIGGKGRSKLIDFLTFGSFNKPFNPPRTDFDWLTRDEQEVDKYINDPQCGFICTTKLWEDLIEGLISISNNASFDAIEHKLPVFFFAGDSDPVGQHGKGVGILAQKFIASYHQDVSLKLYPEGRHEMLNEINAAEVLTDITNWLNQRI